MHVQPHPVWLLGMDVEGANFVKARPQDRHQMLDPAMRSDGTGNAPFAANFFIAAKKITCGTKDTNITCLVSGYYSHIYDARRSLNCEHSRQGAGAFTDLVILGGGGKVEAESAPGTYDPAQVLISCIVES